MNPEFDRQLEAEIDRQLKDLPDLAAPPGLIPTTMNLIARPAAPWHVRPWPSWPAGLRVASLVLTIGVLAELFSEWRAVGPRLCAPVVAWLVDLRAGVQCFWNAVGVLAGAVAPILNHLGKGVLPLCVLAVLLAYAACIGCGTVFVRLALSGARKNLL